MYGITSLAVLKDLLWNICFLRQSLTCRSRIYASCILSRCYEFSCMLDLSHWIKVLCPSSGIHNCRIRLHGDYKLHTYRLKQRCQQDITHVALQQGSYVLYHKHVKAALLWHRQMHRCTFSAASIN